VDGLVQGLRASLIGGGRALGPLAVVLAVVLTVLVLIGLFWLTGLWLRARVQKAQQLGAGDVADGEGDNVVATRAATKRAVALPLGALGTLVTLLTLAMFFAGAGIGAGTVVPQTAAPLRPDPPVPPLEGAPRPTTDPTAPAGSAGQPRTEDIYGENRVVLTSGKGCAQWDEDDVSVEGILYEQGYQFGNSCGTESDTASASYILGRRFSRFTVLIGIVDTSPYPGPVSVEVFLDEDEQQTEFISDVRVGEPLEVDMDVTGAVRVTIRATLRGANTDYVIGFVNAKGVVR
jgi:hypothetical protein